VRDFSLEWPDAALVEALLAAGLLRPWLQARIEQALLADAPVADAAALVPLQQAAMGGDGVCWQAWCEQQGIAAQCLEGLARRRVCLPERKRQWFEAIAHRRFLELGSGLDQVWFSVLQTTDADLAQEWSFKLQDSESEYADLASESLGAERFSGGNVGPVRIKDLQSPLDRLLRRIAPGVVQPPLLTPSGRYWLVRLNQRLPARWEGPLVEELITEAYRNWLNSSLDSLIAHCAAPGERLMLQLPDV